MKPKIPYHPLWVRFGSQLILFPRGTWTRMREKCKTPQTSGQGGNGTILGSLDGISILEQVVDQSNSSIPSDQLTLFPRGGDRVDPVKKKRC